ncbi:hypothetical protein L3Q72_05600 [Vibrio sp. JC009]|uniref:tetratricopeptide repeat protein n=1 Tax=Vibrio sp. JC009 TaxID=2912314 RepID=UPI0023B162DA|nr:hypothetical protein [Vibrio sp. JC009]WED22868.1 hypothetical protein L3Q72_05600 [Vibrio sp. JC009]
MKARYFDSWILKLVLLLALINSATISAEQGLTSATTAQEAYEKAKLLNSQYKKEHAKVYLRFAMAHGHTKAMLMYSELIKHNAFVQQKDESDYALKAAKLGNVNAMIKVTRSIHISEQEKNFFRGRALAILKRKIKHGDIQAIGIMPGLYSDDDTQMKWVMKAAEAGHPHSQYYLAKRYQHETYGWFLISGKRAKEVSRLYKAAAEAGYPPAMAKYASLLAKDSKTKKEAFQWMLKGVEIGKAQSLPFIAYIYTENPDMREVVPRDNVKAAGYLKAYLDVMAPEPNSSSYEIVLEDYEKLLKVMTEPEKQQANKFAQDYLSTHTVRAFDDFWEWGVDYGVRPEGK